MNKNFSERLMKYFSNNDTHEDLLAELLKLANKKGIPIVKVEIDPPIPNHRLFPRNYPIYVFYLDDKFTLGQYYLESDHRWYTNTRSSCWQNKALTNMMNLHFPDGKVTLDGINKELNLSKNFSLDIDKRIANLIDRRNPLPFRESDYKCRSAFLKELKEFGLEEVDTKWNPPENLFKDGSLSKIAKDVWENHGHDLKRSLACINFYINRAGSNLSKDRLRVLEKLKEYLNKGELKS